MSLWFVEYVSEQKQSQAFAMQNIVFPVSRSMAVIILQQLYSTQLSTSTVLC